ncbi:redoxin domain-containing protein [Spirulina subsalsa FACHB-351]|uniref:Redoxin domain-containing protein n=1 Tax=Spirulina subsalsa FACHB-351 TaxID=234711 RepID=A0ABT3L842_9CYAN|nr:thioredoxin domain-containing protein [Spirulina subsalsa]MCW6037649.1 redoxin domain-containing protein [Spirulina subsalsa FACHB-351]
MRKTVILSSVFFSTVAASLSLASLTDSVQASPHPVTLNSLELHASAAGNVGGRLAPQLQGKPVVVDIYASWCPACRNIAPTLSQLKEQYGEQVHFIVFDVSDQTKAKASEAKAKELGLGSFFAAHKSQTGMVAIIDPATGDILAQHRNNTNLSAYTSVLNSAISSP